MPKLLPHPIQGKSDWRQYRSLQLGNNIQAVLVHDDKAVLTACSVCVNDAGASNDPRSYSGLAHFVEHMVFYGSKKYPVENYYKRYLATHGGKSNASTSMSCATFKFEVMQEHAEEAVDIFAQFFAEPLFTESGTSREVNAVDSENSKNMATDGRRRLQILKALADPEHHYSKFSTGNKETLLPDDLQVKEVREALLAFHKRHYRPKNMSVVIVGPQDLDTLQDWIVPRFEVIPDRFEEEERNEMDQLIADAAKDSPDSITATRDFNPSFRPDVQGGKWPVQLTTRPLKASRLLTLYFPVPPVESAEIHDRCPVSILGHLLGHEGRGSPFAAMQDAGLLAGLSTGSKVSAHDQTLMQVNIALTPQGEKRWKDVVSVLFAHIRIVQETIDAAWREKQQLMQGGDVVKNDDSYSALKDMERIFDEILHLKHTSFNMSLPGTPYGVAPGLAQALLHYGSEKCLSCGASLDESKDTLPLEMLKDFVERLTPSNCIIERCSQVAWDEAIDRETNLLEANPEARSNDYVFGLRKEKWYGVEYHLDSIDDGDVAIWEGVITTEDGEVQQMLSKLYLPTPNVYITEKLDLCDELPEEAKHGPRIEKSVDPPKLVVQNDYGEYVNCNEPFYFYIFHILFFDIIILICYLL